MSFYNQLDNLVRNDIHSGRICAAALSPEDALPGAVTPQARLAFYVVHRALLDYYAARRYLQLQPDCREAQAVANECEAFLTSNHCREAFGYDGRELLKRLEGFL